MGIELHGLAANQIAYLAPELTLIIAAVVLAILDLALPKSAGRAIIPWLTLASIVVAIVMVIFQLNPEAPIQILNQSYRVDDFANLMKLVFLVATGLIVFMSIGNVKDVSSLNEMYYLLLPALVGAMAMASSADLITLYVGLELLSITSYILVGLRKRNSLSTEGAFKYIVQGGISSATILYGMSFLYGISGSTNLGAIQGMLMQKGTDFGAMIYVAFFLILAGFGFKIAAAPFHTWAPDVYQGAPTPITAFLAVVSKAASFAVLFRLIYDIFFGVQGGLPFEKDVFFAAEVLAAIAMIVGNALALKQQNVKRLLAYSGVANAGYLLVPLASQFAVVHYSNFSEFLYYLVAYLLMNIGAFAILMMIEAHTGTEELSGYAGLYYRAPATAVAMLLLVLSLAGFPVTGGFFGKLFILIGVLQTGAYWLAAIMIVTSVLSFYYYFRVLRQMFMRTETDPRDFKVSWTLSATAWICAVASVVIGFFPQWILGYVDKIFSIANDLFPS